MPQKYQCEKETSSHGTHYYAACLLGIKKLQACQKTMHRMHVGTDNVDHAHLDAALKRLTTKSTIGAPLQTLKPGLTNSHKDVLDGQAMSRA